MVFGVREEGSASTKGYKLSRQPTCWIYGLAISGFLGGGLDDLLEALVVDVGAGPFGDLIAREACGGGLVSVNAAFLAVLGGLRSISPKQLTFVQTSSFLSIFPSTLLFPFWVCFLFFLSPYCRLVRTARGGFGKATFFFSVMEGQPNRLSHTCDDCCFGGIEQQQLLTYRAAAQFRPLQLITKRDL